MTLDPLPPALTKNLVASASGGQKGTMKFLPRCLVVAGLCLIPCLPAAAEGIASETTVTTKNHTALEHHTLQVKLVPHEGITSVQLTMKTDPDRPLAQCFVTILKKEGDPAPFVSFQAKVGQPVSFDVSDDAVDRVKVMYFIHANGSQNDIFNIQPGELGKLAKADAGK